MNEQNVAKFIIETVKQNPGIMGWLEQFDQLGSHRWIGEGLLKVMDFWPEDRLLASVGLTAEALAVFDRVCFHQQRAGKSADVLANLFAKHIRPLNAKFPDIEDFYKVLTDGQHPSANGRILFIEDGIFSGTEMTKLFGDLLGIKTPEGRKQKAPQLADLSQLRNKNITLLFPVATSFGVARLEEFLRENNLTNVEVNHCPHGWIEVLSPAGSEALKNGRFFEPEIRNCPLNPGEHFLKIPFQNMAVWKKVGTAHRATAFCHEIGGQLFRQYLQARDWQWPELKIQRCSLGMYGMGLAFAFAHSVPKASLPLFWAPGKIQFKKKIFDWMPLFPNAA